MQEIAGRTPYWMQGNFAPVKEEVTAIDLPVEGAIPPELCGLYVRNGANPVRGESSHWFLGDGMVHGVSLKNGKAEWYRNRWIRTPPYKGQPRTPLSAFDLRYSVANTHIIAHANRIMALCETSLPMELTRELKTADLQRLRRQTENAIHRASQDMLVDRRVAFLRLQGVASVPHLSCRGCIRGSPSQH